MNFPALTYLLTVPGRLYPEERKELAALLARTPYLEKVQEDAGNLVDALPAVLDPAEDIWPPHMARCEYGTEGCVGIGEKHWCVRSAAGGR